MHDALYIQDPTVAVITYGQRTKRGTLTSPPIKKINNCVALQMYVCVSVNVLGLIIAEYNKLARLESSSLPARN